MIGLGVSGAACPATGSESTSDVTVVDICVLSGPTEFVCHARMHLSKAIHRRLRGTLRREKTQIATIRTKRRDANKSLIANVFICCGMSQDIAHGTLSENS